MQTHIELDVCSNHYKAFEGLHHSQARTRFLEAFDIRGTRFKSDFEAMNIITRLTANISGQMALHNYDKGATIT